MENKKTKPSVLNLKGNKFLQYALICVLGAAVLIIFLTSFDFGSNSQNNSRSLTADEYVAELEDRMSKILSKIENAGEVAVMITVDSGMERVLAEEVTVNKNQSGTETVTELLTVGGDVVVLKELYPHITGVLIVSKGAGNITVTSKLLNAVSVLLNVEPSKIEILSMK